jgi:hypothetical protein
MLIPLIIAAKDSASAAIRGISASLNGLKGSANEAAKAASSIAVKTSGTAKINELQKQINDSTAALSRNKLQEAARSASASAAIAQSVVEERRRQAELKKTQAAAIALSRAEEGLLKSRARSNAASAALKNFDAKAALRDMEALNKSTALLPRTLQSTGSIGGSALTSLVGGMDASAIASTALVGIIGGSLVAALGAATAAASYFGKEFSDSINRQKESISAAEPLVKSFGLSYTDADNRVRQTQERVAILGRDLPVSSKEINTVVAGISDNLAGMLKKAGMGIDDLAKYQDTIGSKGAILTSSTASSDTTDFNRLFDKLDSGATIASVKMLQLYEQSPQIRSALEETFKKYDIKSTKDLKATEKPQFMLDLLNSAVSDEQVKRLQGTVAAQVSSAMDRLFDPFTGIFGFERDLYKDKEGVQSIFSELAKSINLIIGEGGILANISKAIGGTGDPLKDLYEGIVNVNRFLESINKFLTEFNSVSSRVDKARETFASVAQPALNMGKGAIDISRGNALGGTGKILQGVGGLVNDFTIKPVWAGIQAGMRGIGMGGLFSDIGAKPQYKGSSDLSPSTFPGLMPIQSAIAAEMRNKPTGSSLAIANTSETILTPEQVRAISSPQTVITNQTAGSNKTLTLAPGAIVINPPPGMNINEIANTIFSMLDDRFNQAQSELLS